MIEGNPNEHRKLKNAPWDAGKIAKKTTKHVLFFALSFVIANTFLAYIIGVDELFKIMTEPIALHFGGFVAILVFTGAFYIVYAFAREIVCTVICPYGRLQVHFTLYTLLHVKLFARLFVLMVACRACFLTETQL
jgi:polyferredoxin